MTAPPLFPHGETVQRLAFVSLTRDAHGVEVITRADPVDVDGAGFDPGGSYETLPDGTRIVTQPELYVGFAQATHPLDQWACRGKRYDVDGDAAQWLNPFTGWQAGQAIKLKRVTG